MAHSSERANFGSKLGVILATAGSAVGLGNVWRFPYMTGENGGAAFILIYIACVVLLGIPCMLSEFIIGRHGAANTSRVYAKVAAEGLADANSKLLIHINAFRPPNLPTAKKPVGNCYSPSLLVFWASPRVSSSPVTTR